MHFNKPLIGITLSQADKAKNYRWPVRRDFDYLSKAYHYSIEKSGGRPIGLFNTTDGKIINDHLELVDGILFTGGIDMNPRYYNQRRHYSTSKAIEPRDGFELMMLKKAIKLKIPIFCICRGHQLLNVALGGNLYQDLSLYGNRTLEHADTRQTGKVNHYVHINKDSLLFDIIGRQKIYCNSSHHQCINKVGKGLHVSAEAPDGIIEGLELKGHPFLLSVQWHPERIFARKHSRKLFMAFMEASCRGT